MKIIDQFKNSIKDFFYDKDIDIDTVADTIDSEGWAKKTAVASGTTFKGNINFNRLDEVQAEFGLDTQIDATVTTDYKVDLGQVLSYGSYQYKVIKAVEYDSHYLLILQKWLSKSSDLTSA